MSATQGQLSNSKPRPVEILLVEDNPADVRLLRETFRRSRFEIRLNIIPDGEAAMDYLCRPYHSSPRPDMILLDLNLPRKNGHDIAALIKSSRHLNDIPLLILTSSSHHEDMWRAVQNRVSAYILKPLSLGQYDLFLNYIEEKWMEKLPLDLPPSG